MVASVTFLLWLAGAANLASAEEVSATLHRLGDADLVLISDPAGDRPVRVVLATRVASPVDKVRQVIADPSAYGKAMPSFRRVEVVSKHAREPGVTDVEVAWELEVPLRNLSGKLWLRSRDDGVDLQLVEGDFAPGLFHLSARKAKPGGKAEAVLTKSVLTIEGFANVRDANWATRQIVQRSSTAEPAITVAAAYVMLKSLARLAEGALPARPNAAMTAPEPASLNGALAGQTANVVTHGKRVLAAVRSRADGRLLNVAVAVQVAAPADLVTRRTLQPRPFVHMPGWKKITPVSGNPEPCKDTAALCWKVDTNLPVFSLDGIWKIRPRPWRAHMVDGDNTGAVMGIDVLPGKPAGRSTLILSQHPRLDTAGYVARKLIAAEPFLEHGLALALTLVEAVALAPALEKD